MAHFTGLKQLQNHPHRSCFDIEAKNVFSAKCGELLPIFWDLGLPGCTYDIDLQYFTRTRPVQTAAYTRIREYFDFYAVPIDLLWKSFDSSVIQMGEIAPVQSKTLIEALTVKGDLPWCTSADLGVAVYYSGGNRATGPSPSVVSGFESIFGYNRGDLSYKLLHMLNYGNIIGDSTSTVGGTANRWWNMQSPLDAAGNNLYSQRFSFNFVNLFPLLTYQKIYQDFFRWSQWENANPSSYNVDYFDGVSPSLVDSLPAANSAYWKSDTMFDLKYCNWNKDMLMGVLPNSQFGDVAVLDIDATGDSNVVLGIDPHKSTLGVASAVS